MGNRRIVSTVSLSFFLLRLNSSNVPSPSSLLPPGDAPGYDALILSDLLHFDAGHESLIASIEALLKKTVDSRVHVSAGLYTKPHLCDSFLAKSKAAGLEFEEIRTDPEEVWMGTMQVNTLDREALALRKAACRYWVGRWNPSHLP